MSEYPSYDISYSLVRYSEILAHFFIKEELPLRLFQWSGINILMISLFSKIEIFCGVATIFYYVRVSWTVNTLCVTLNSGSRAGYWISDGSFYLISHIIYLSLTIQAIYCTVDDA